MKGYLYILGTVLCTVYAQLIIKWQAAGAGSMPAETGKKVLFFSRLMVNPWVISSLFAAFLAFLCWTAAMTKFKLSYAYPFISLGFVLVLLMSAVCFHEAITLPKLLGMSLIVIGIIVGSQG